MSRALTTRGVGWRCITASLRRWTRRTQAGRQLGIPWGLAPRLASACASIRSSKYIATLKKDRKKTHTHAKKKQTKTAPHLPSKPSALVKDARPTAWEPNIFPLSSQQLLQSSTNPPLPSELKSAWLLGWGEERQIHSLWDRAAQPRGWSAWLSMQPGTSELEAGSRRYVSSFHLG